MEWPVAWRRHSQPLAGAGAIQGNRGYDAVVGFNYDWQHQSIDDAGQQLASFLDQLSQCNGGVGQIDVEAHSEGVPVTISAGGPAKTAKISNFVSFGGPILRTPVASNAQNFVTGFVNTPGFDAGASFLHDIETPFLTELAPGNSQFAADRAILGSIINRRMRT